MMEGSGFLVLLFVFITVLFIMRWTCRIFVTNQVPTLRHETERRRVESPAEVTAICIKVLALCCCDRLAPASSQGPNVDVRRAAVYTIASDPRGNGLTNRFPDFFWDVSTPNAGSNGLSKDEKDLPSYEDVMRMEMEREATNSSIPAPTTTLPPANTIETIPATRLTV